MNLPRALSLMACALLATHLTAQAPAPRPSATTLEQLLPLRPEEGVFAYYRLSPDGQVLAFTSETPVNGKLALSPHPVPGLARIPSLAAGGYHTLLLTHGRKLLACGQNVFGQLGDWNYADSALPRDALKQVLQAGR